LFGLEISVLSSSPLHFEITMSFFISPLRKGYYECYGTLPLGGGKCTSEHRAWLIQSAPT
jgi:hypothetical protein